LTRGVTVAIRILPFTSVTKTQQLKKNNGNIKRTQWWYRIFRVLVFEQCYRNLCPHARVMADLVCLFTIIPNRHLLISVSSCQFERKKELKIFISFYFILFHFISLIAIKTLLFQWTNIAFNLLLLFEKNMAAETDKRSISMSQHRFVS
jgi:hypothetical protein